MVAAVAHRSGLHSSMEDGANFDDAVMFCLAEVHGAYRNQMVLILPELARLDDHSGRRFLPGLLPPLYSMLLP